MREHGPWENLASLYEADFQLEEEDLRGLQREEKFRHFFELNYGQISEDKVAVVGRDGFLFVNDGSNLWKDQLAGRISIDAGVLAETVSSIESFQGQASARGLPFHCLFIPEKDVVHHDLSPNAQNGVAAQRSVHRIMSALSFSSIYPVEDLVGASKVLNPFHRRNSHFNFFGGYIVANALLTALGHARLPIKDIEANHVYGQDDLAFRWVQDFKTRRRAVLRSYREDILFDVPGHVGKYILLTNLQARTDKTMVLCGDSYAWNYDAGVCRFLSYVYRQVHFIWKKRIDWEWVDRIKPDAIVLQSAERFLIKGLQ